MLRLYLLIAHLGYFTACSADLGVQVTQANIKPCVGDHCPVIQSYRPIAAYVGETVVASGEGFKPEISILIAGQAVTIEYISDQEARFVMPEGRPGLLKVDLSLDRLSLVSPKLYRLSKDNLFSTASQSEVCDGQSFYNINGELVTGTKKCDANSSDVTVNENMLSSEFVSDSITGSIPTCSNEGESDCILRDSFAAGSNLSIADKLVSGHTVLGVNGNVVLPAITQVNYGIEYGSGSNQFSGTGLGGDVLCTAGGQSSCITSPSYPTMDLSITSGTGLSTANFDTTIRTASNFEFWDSTGLRHVLTGNASLAASNIRSGVEIHGITGIAVFESHTNCNTDGQSGCVSHPSFTAAQVSGGSNKILSGQSLAGVSGNITLPATSVVRSITSYGPSGSSLTGLIANCSTDGQSSCVTSSSYIATQVSGAASKLVSGQTLGGVPGTVVLPTSSQVLTAVSYGASGSQFTGSATAESHSTCTADGGLSCVTDSSYPAALISGAADKILSGQSLAGESGTVGLPTQAAVRSGVNYGIGGSGSTGSLPDCSSDGETTCITSGTYAAGELTGAADKVLSGQTLAGVSGNVTIPSPSNVLTGISYGVGGTQFTGGALLEAHTDCTSDGQIGCVSTASFLAGLTTGAASKIISGQTLAGVSGNVVLPSATDVRDSATYGTNGTGTSGSLALCNSDGETACITHATYTSAQSIGAADKIISGQSLAGIAGNVVVPAASTVRSPVSYGVGGTGSTGTLDTCSSDGELGCIAVTTYRAAETSGAANKIISGQSLAGVNGNFVVPAVSNVLTGAQFGASGTQYTGTAVAESHSNCSSDSAQGCVTTASYPAAEISGASSKMLSGQSLAGENGNISLPAQASVLNSTSYGVGGTGLSGTINDCSANGQDNCYVNSTSSFDAADLSNLSASNIKRGESIAGVTGNFPSASNPLPRYIDSGSTTTTTGSDETDLTNLSTQLVSSGSFEFWDSSGVRRLGSGDTDIIASNVVSGVVFENISLTGSATASTQPPAGVRANVDGPNQVTLTWDDIGSTGYVLVVRQGASVSFTPSNGISYSTGPQGADSIVYVGSSLSYIHTGLTAGSTYHYALFSYESGPVYSTSTTLTQAVSSFCSTLSGSWVLVPGDSDYGVNDFCVMKYEARDIASTATSTPSGTPWISIAASEARNECQSLGPYFDLITNDQWMALVSNLANVGSNWSSSSVGSGNLYSGHNDSDPNMLCAASSDPSLAYVEGDCTAIAAGSGENSESTQRRTSTLSNGEVIWDMGGNAAEWVQAYYYAAERANPATNTTVEFTTVTDGTGLKVKDLIPTNAVKSFWNDSWNSTQGIGMWSGEGSGGTSAMHRGGRYSDGSVAGLFTSMFKYGHSQTATHVGFRCVRLIP